LVLYLVLTKYYSALLFVLVVCFWHPAQHSHLIWSPPRGGDDELQSYDVFEAFTVKHESWLALDVEGDGMMCAYL
jgi:hypothetical protein